jgi:hypothetical protein
MASERIGRPAGSVTKSVLIGAVVGRHDRDSNDRLAAARSEPGLFGAETWLEAHKDAWTVGSPQNLLRRFCGRAAVEVVQRAVARAHAELVGVPERT